jgi:hypothetical protein
LSLFKNIQISRKDNLKSWNIHVLQTLKETTFNDRMVIMLSCGDALMLLPEPINENGLALKKNWIIVILLRSGSQIKFTFPGFLPAKDEADSQKRRQSLRSK